MTRPLDWLAVLLPSGKTTLLHPLLLAAVVAFSIGVMLAADAAFGNVLVTGAAALMAISVVPPLRRWWAPRDPGQDYDQLPDSTDVTGSGDDLVTSLGALAVYAAAVYVWAFVLDGVGAMPDLGSVEGGRTADEMAPIIGLLIACGPIWSEAEARIAAYRIQGRDSEARDLARSVEEATESPTDLVPSGAIEVAVRRGRAWAVTVIAIGATPALIVLGVNDVSEEGWGLGAVALFLCAPIALAGGFRHAWLYGVAPYLLKADSTGFDPMGAGTVPWANVRSIALSREDRLFYLAFEIASRSREDEEAEDHRIVGEIKAAERAGDKDAAASLAESLFDVGTNQKLKARWWTRRHQAALHGATNRLRVPMGLSRLPAQNVAAAVSVLSGQRIERVGRGDVPTRQELADQLAQIEDELEAEPKKSGRNQK